MTRRLGLGPVFKYEWIVATRRWQLYAVRSLFVLAILAAISLFWMTAGPEADTITTDNLAMLGAAVYGAMVWIQITMVLLIAPAMTAGAVCLDKSRGTLDHLLATDLSNTEIVLGKLAVRLFPIMGIVGSLLPALVLTTLLGGVDPDALFGSFLVTLGTATFACALTFTLSTWGNKIHEVLCTAYLLLLGWVLALPVGSLLGYLVGSFRLSNQFWTYGSPANPYYLVSAPYTSPESIGYGSWLAYLAGCLLVSTLLIVLATWRIRIICLKQAGRGAISRSHSEPKPPARWKFWAHGPKFHLPRPTLNGNPVLWREWHRTRPSRWMAFVWWSYGTTSLFFSSVVLYEMLNGNDGAALEIGLLINVFQVNVGLLLLNIQAVTSLSEERMRGSLDVLMTTPLTTRQILAGKWWGAWRILPRLMVLPSMVAGVIALFSNHWELWPCFVLLLSGYGAVAISTGLACATWISRPSRAIAASISLCFCFNAVIGVLGLWVISYDVHYNDEISTLTKLFVPLLASFTGSILSTTAMDEHLAFDISVFGMQLCFITSSVFQYLIASTLFVTAWLSFDRRLGRSSNRRRRIRPPSRAGIRQRKGTPLPS